MQVVLKRHSKKHLILDSGSGRQVYPVRPVREKLTFRSILLRLYVRVSQTLISRTAS